MEWSSNIGVQRVTEQNEVRMVIKNERTLEVIQASFFFSYRYNRKMVHVWIEKMDVNHEDYRLTSILPTARREPSAV
jgi:hypothetical protein